ncbi:MAG: nucleoside triphosphate pyrophosphohydrolase [Beijerinckiaceae bacterium]
MTPSTDIQCLLDIMAALRTPETGCPWDLAQSFATIVPYTIEEAYEVADAIQRGDLADLRDELGDLLLQVVFHARMAQEAGAFDFGGVVQAITEKLIRRHPHVFGDVKDLSPEDVKALWGQIKAEEKRQKTVQRQATGRDVADAAGLLDDVPLALPALTRAVKLQDKAGAVGFDWNDPMAVLAKMQEELDELKQEVISKNSSNIRDEMGDFLFAAANLCRHLDVDPEAAMRLANSKFERRFRYIEQTLAARGQALADASLEVMDGLWNEAKRGERSG